MLIEEFPFQAVLWDMDGTLLDSEPIWIAEEREFMSSLGATWNQEDALFCIGGPMKRVDDYMRSKLPEEIRDQYPELALSKVLLERMEIRLNQEIPFTLGAKALIDDIYKAGIPMALVTASTRAIMDGALNSIGKHYFKVTISDNDVENSKPNPEGYILAASRIGVEIENCLIIEDSATGSRAAIESGGYLLGLTDSGPLPSGDKVVHRENLKGLNLAGLVKLFQPLLVKN